MKGTMGITPNKTIIGHETFIETDEDGFILTGRDLNSGEGIELVLVWEELPLLLAYIEKNRMRPV
jgi:hypothetical protein